MTTRGWAATIAATMLLSASCGGSHKAASHPANGTAAKGTLEESQIGNAQAARMEDLLARVPGLQVVQSPGGYTLRVWGSRTGSDGPRDEPLLVVDGMPSRSGSNYEILSSLNPQDVGRIEVLKDAASTARYGMSGVNGVVLITTKRGRKP